MTLLLSLGEIPSYWDLGAVGVVFGWTGLVRYLYYQLDFLGIGDMLAPGHQRIEGLKLVIIRIDKDNHGYFKPIVVSTLSMSWMLL